MADGLAAKVAKTLDELGREEKVREWNGHGRGRGGRAKEGAGRGRLGWGFGRGRGRGRGRGLSRGLAGGRGYGKNSGWGLTGGGGYSRGYGRSSSWGGGRGLSRGRGFRRWAGRGWLGVARTINRSQGLRPAKGRGRGIVAARWQDAGAQLGGAPRWQERSAPAAEAPVRRRWGAPGRGAARGRGSLLALPPSDFGAGAPGPRAPQYAPERAVFFLGAPFSASLAELTRVFEVAGSLSKVALFSLPDGSSRGMGIVEYTSAEAADVAYKTLHKTTIDGRTLVVDRYAPPELL